MLKEMNLGLVRMNEDNTQLLGAQYMLSKWERKLGDTLTRDIINALLGFEGKEKITWNEDKETGAENKLRVEKARNLIKDKVIAGEFGEEAKVEYEEYIKKEIDLINLLNS